MPEFSGGETLGFRTRVCPVVRTRKAGSRPLQVNRHGRLKHREVDAFIHAIMVAPKDVTVDRRQVYTQWLGRELERDGAGSLNTADLVESKRERMQRRRVSIERPNVVLEGHLTVRDPLAFRVLLSRGIGRHRAFGFGMLLLRPALR
jgi:CRISPR system Cascade subunit CasE